MHAPRRRVLQATAATAAAAVAGCSSLTESAQLLVVRNRSERTRSVTVTIRRAPDATATDGTAATAATSANTTATTAGTSPRFVVDFDFELEAGGRTELVQAIPSDGAYEVLATVPDLATGRGSYVDTESVRVTITSDGVDVATFTPE